MVKVENKFLNSTVVTTECMVDDGNKNTEAILELLSSLPSSYIRRTSSEYATTSPTILHILMIYGCRTKY